jgi:hypothetical protein
MAIFRQSSPRGDATALDSEEENHYNRQPWGEFVGIENASFAAITANHARATSPLKTFLSRYFYLCASIVMAVLSVWAFSHTVDARLLHANPPRPLLLWFHAVLFSVWIVLFITQSALVRVREVRVHRTLGWFGAALAAAMVFSGFIVSVVMLRFEMTAALNRNKVASFLSILWFDMIIFGACIALAIYFRKRPEFHRRLVFMASCQLMQATFVRFDYIGYHDLFYPALDVLVMSGMLRDWVVEGRVNKIYLYVLPAMIVLQAWATYLERTDPSWWQAATQAILG